MPSKTYFMFAVNFGLFAIEMIYLSFHCKTLPPQLRAILLMMGGLCVPFFFHSLKTGLLRRKQGK